MLHVGRHNREKEKKVHKINSHYAVHVAETISLALDFKKTYTLLHILAALKFN